MFRSAATYHRWTQRGNLGGLIVERVKRLGSTGTNETYIKVSVNITCKLPRVTLMAPSSSRTAAVSTVGGTSTSVAAASFAWSDMSHNVGYRGYEDTERYERQEGMNGVGEEHDHEDDHDSRKPGGRHAYKRYGREKSVSYEGEEHCSRT